ncbi:hypothetical protein EVAR_12822_1 [Eumeta japonica]|uniref:Uncharacterized protein n=1 Tax=Eumeta variegata TaxID=151549 RepID=A0A4C1UBM6_EUMVA|nr:hypothetical protein EVAR_12822_1 [Eumeta japonica]
MPKVGSTLQGLRVSDDSIPLCVRYRSVAFQFLLAPSQRRGGAARQSLSTVARCKRIVYSQPAGRIRNRLSVSSLNLFLSSAPAQYCAASKREDAGVENESDRCGRRGLFTGHDNRGAQTQKVRSFIDPITQSKVDRERARRLQTNACSSQRLSL